MVFWPFCFPNKENASTNKLPHILFENKILCTINTIVVLKDNLSERVLLLLFQRGTLFLSACRYVCGEGPITPGELFSTQTPLNSSSEDAAVTTATEEVGVLVADWRKTTINQGPSQDFRAPGQTVLGPKGVTRIVFGGGYTQWAQESSYGNIWAYLIVNTLNTRKRCVGPFNGGPDPMAFVPLAYGHTLFLFFLFFREYLLWPPYITIQ